jgi:PucR C-terminal helix-turn-helix domain/GGDEF-like domain
MPANTPRSLTALRSTVAERLRGRREEIHEAVIHRALEVAPPSGQEAPGYVEALRAAIPSAVEHAFDVVEVGEERVGPTPAPIFVQAAASSRSAVGLEVVMRRYAAGYSTLSDFLQQEILAVNGNSVQGYTALQRELTALFERFVGEVSATYRQEEARSLPSPGQRRLERVRRLLAGELVDPGGLDYPLDGFHLAVIISGSEPEAMASQLADRLGRRYLIGESSLGRCAIWLGGSRPFEPAVVDEAVRTMTEAGLRLSLGEPGEGLAGWRRTRRQAEAAHLVTERCEEPVVRYRDVALSAAALRDPDLRHFLIETYVEPLQDHPSDLMRTLGAVLERGGNASAAAAALGIARQTVNSRLQIAERLLGRPAIACGSQLETAIQLTRLDG